MAGLLFAIPRLTKRPILSDRLGWVIVGAWNLILVLSAAGQLLGYGQAIEWGETPIFVDPLVVVGLVLLVVNMAWPILQTREQGLYVSLWYFLAAFAWTGLVYLMGNYLPQFWIPGTAGAAITGLFIHDLVGLFVTPIGIGLMYFFVPLLLRKPVWSHALSMIGFWGLAFFYPMQGVHHFLFSPIPMYAQYGAVVATIAVEIVVITVIVNFFATLHGRADAIRGNLAVRWFFTGMVFYAITCFQCAFQVTLTFQKIIHFTDWVVAHAHMVMFGVFGFWIMGVFVELWPRVVRPAVGAPAAAHAALLADVHRAHRDGDRPHRRRPGAGLQLGRALALGRVGGRVDAVLVDAHRRRARHHRGAGLLPLRALGDGAPAGAGRGQRGIRVRGRRAAQV